MPSPLLRLYPGPTARVSLTGRYLAHDLRHYGAVGRPFVYANFLVSLDGRAAVADPRTGRRRVPPAIANGRDWRLYMELAAQADALLISDKLLRAVAQGRYAEMVDLGQEGLEDLIQWRRRRGLLAQPAVAAISPDLRLPVPVKGGFFPDEVLVLTTGGAPAGRARDLEQAGVEVVRAGPGPRLTGGEITGALAERGHAILYSLAGPGVLHTLAADGEVNRLYLTTALSLLGGEGYDTLTRGPGLARPAGFRLSELYLDATAPEGSSQLFHTLIRG